LSLSKIFYELMYCLLVGAKEEDKRKQKSKSTVHPSFPLASFAKV
jgi:hypothetical protein